MAIWFSFRFSVLRLYPGCKKLRVISPLFIVLSCIEGRHWTLATLSFIRGIWPHTIKWKWGNVGVTCMLLRVWVFLFISLHWVLVYLRPTSFIRRILPCSYLSKLGITLDPFWDASHHLMWYYDRFVYYGWKKPVLQDLVKKYHIPIPPLEVIQTQRIQVNPQITWCVGSLESSEVPYKGLNGLLFLLHNTSLHAT